MPFPTTFHVAVYKCNPSDEDKARDQAQSVFQVGVVLGGYFELSLAKREHRHAMVPSVFDQDSMTSIGLMDLKFPLVSQQLGWTPESYGYHSDDGRFYHGTAFEGLPFGPTFKAARTVGCGMRINLTTGTMHVFFTNNGELIAGEDGAFVCEHREYRMWFPGVGLDSYDALHLNFGQEPFAYSAVTDELFEECNNMGHTVVEQLKWHGPYRR